MKKFNNVSVVVGLAAILSIFLVGTTKAATNVNLGSADSFAIIAGTAITSVPTSDITGNVGLSPAAGSNYSGLNAVDVAGTIYAADATGPAGSVSNPTLLTTAKTDLSNAYDGLVAGGNATCTTTYAGTQDLVGMSLVPGVYCADAFALSGTLNLSGSGVWIFRSSATLVTSGNANIVGGNACNVWWRVASSATLGTNTSLIGNILALTAIDLNTGASLSGRALARNGAVTLDQNTVSAGSCTTTTVASSASQDIKVTKDGDKKNLRSGPEKVTFTYKVTNESNTPLTNVSLKDDKCDDVDFINGDDNDDDILDLDEEWKYRCKKTVKKTETNTATAKGTANGVEVKDKATFKVTVSTPGLPNAGVESNNGVFDKIWSNIVSFFSF